ncbi:MAG TPA: carboxylesterase family protein [Myxococcota bacterium]|nr:carboxylesterase family protein [Myxococcota bacterium]
MPSVETPHGRLEGARSEREPIARFFGIPYTAPPVGALRLRPPQPPTPWRGTRDATRFGAAQPQREDPLAGGLGLLHGARCDEDCLTLNVFTPACDAAARPVLVWMHGGAFIGGTACVPLYDASRLAARGDVVVVTLNYRVGALGWSFPDGPHAEEVANLGLQDQIAALRWVRDTIVCFGGDPARVTVVGESAGAGSILSLAGMPAARGLFHGAVVQSGAPRGVLEPAEASARTHAVLAKLGAPEGGIEALRDAPLAALLEAQSACAAAGPHRTGMFYAPVHDRRALRDSPSHAFATGFAAELPLLIGTTRDEMRLYASGQPDSEAGVARIVAPQLDWLGEAQRKAACRELYEAHRAARSERGEPCAPSDVYLAIQTELSLRHPAIRIAEAREATRNTWMYQFTWRSPLRGGLHGACHALDLPFTFGNLDAPGMAEFAGGGEAALRLAARMMDAWCSFARHGDPAHDGIGSWPAYERSRRATFELGARCGVRDAPQEAERRALERLGFA